MLLYRASVTIFFSLLDCLWQRILHTMDISTITSRLIICNDFAARTDIV